MDGHKLNGRPQDTEQPRYGLDGHKLKEAKKLIVLPGDL